MHIVPTLFLLASSGRAAILKDGRQYLIQKGSIGQAASRRGLSNLSGWANTTHNVDSSGRANSTHSVNSSGWANSTYSVNVTKQLVPMDVCPLGGIVPDKERIKWASAATAYKAKVEAAQKAQVEAMHKVVQQRLKLSPAAQTPKQVLQKIAGNLSHHYVFITGLAYTGTTSLYGLLSTSPQTSNLCKGLGNCCEGAPILEKAGLWPYNQASNPAYPADWKRALAVYSKYWDMSKRILLEKSVNNMNRFPKLYQAVRSIGANASFIYVVRSTCFFKHNLYGSNRWLTGMSEVLQSAQQMRNAGAKVLIVKWEDVVGNPFAVAQDLLKFLPELVSLDPTKNGLHSAPYVIDNYVYRNFRAVPTATYSSNLGKVQAVNQGKSIPTWEQKVMEALGYTRQWFEKTPWLQWGTAFPKLAFLNLHHSETDD